MRICLLSAHTWSYTQGWGMCSASWYMWKFGICNGVEQEHTGGSGGVSLKPHPFTSSPFPFVLAPASLLGVVLPPLGFVSQAARLSLTPGPLHVLFLCLEAPPLISPPPTAHPSGRCPVLWKAFPPGDRAPALWFSQPRCPSWNPNSWSLWA